MTHQDFKTDAKFFAKFRNGEMFIKLDADVRDGNIEEIRATYFHDGLQGGHPFDRRARTDNQIEKFLNAQFSQIK